MRKTLLLMGLAGTVSVSPSLANAQPFFPGGDCWHHRVAGTVLGGVGGGAIGAALAAGVAVTPWAWAAAGVGALVGHAIGVSRCRHWREAYYSGYYDGPPPAYPYAYYHPRYGYYAPAHEYYRREYPYYSVHYYHHYHHYHHHCPCHAGQSYAVYERVSRG